MTQREVVSGQRLFTAPFRAWNLNDGAFAHLRFLCGEKAFVMHCQRCGTPMRESPAVHHKKRKWICPRCGRARMQRTDKTRKGRGAGRKERSGGWED